MSTLLLRLEGPLQAWSSQGKLSVRDTESEPTKSGVLGLVGAAIGMDRSDDATLAALARLKMAVRSDREGTLLRDYHTAGGGTFRGEVYGVYPEKKGTVQSTRYYLQDAAFTVGLYGDPPLLDRIASGLRNPVWPLFLGRRSCPVSSPPLLGIVDSPLRKAIEEAPFAERAGAHKRRVTIECDDPSEGDPRTDVPLSFREGARRYGVRYVKTVWLDAAKASSPNEEAAP